MATSRTSVQRPELANRPAVNTKVKVATLLGYLETDFLGIVPGNVAVSANSDTLRLRLFWADLREGQVQFLAGRPGAC